MKKIFVLTFTFLIPSFTQAMSGLFPLDDHRVPEGVRKAAPAIFQIATYLNKASFKVNQEDYPHILESMDVSILDNKIIRSYVEKCDALNLPVCFINFSGSLTGFLAGNGETLWTARHGFDDWVKEISPALDPNLTIEEKHHAVMRVPLKIQIYDAKQNLVFDSRTKKQDIARFSVLGNAALLAKNLSIPPRDDDEGLEQDYSDFACILLSRPIGKKWLTITNEVPQLLDHSFILGFPTKTEGRFGFYKVPDSTGRGLRVSIGKIVKPTKSYFSATTNSPKVRRALNRSIRTALLVSDWDAVPGQSGAPILKANGTVAGIFRGHAARINQSPEDSYSSEGGSGVHFKWIETLLKEFPVFKMTDEVKN